MLKAGKKMKRIMVPLALLFLLVMRTAAAAEDFAVDAKGAVLIDAASGRVLFAQNADEAFPMASTTKIMTCLLALENAALDEKVTAGKNAHGVEGTSIYLSEGETLTMEQMLYGLMLRSGNDAAVAIAEHVSGSVEEFANMMNVRAEELDADARFANPHGLDAEGHRASALGLAKIMRAAMKHEAFRTISSTQKKIIPWVGNEYSRVLENKNKLLKTYEGATGGKTGYTSKAGRCLVFSAERGGMSLIGVVLNCPTWFDTAAVMLDYGFENFGNKTALKKGETAAEAAVEGGDSALVAAVAAEELSVLAEEGEQYTLRYEFDALHAPVRKGQRVGRAILEIEGSVVDECDLVAADDVEKSGLASALKRILRQWVMMFAA